MIKYKVITEETIYGEQTSYEALIPEGRENDYLDFLLVYAGVSAELEPIEKVNKYARGARFTELLYEEQREIIPADLLAIEQSLYGYAITITDGLVFESSEIEEV